MAAIDSARPQRSRPQALIRETVGTDNFQVTELTPQLINCRERCHFQIDYGYISAILHNSAPDFFQIAGQRDSFEMALQVFSQEHGILGICLRKNKVQWLHNDSP